MKTLIIKVFKYSYRGGEKCVCAGVLRESNTVLAAPTTVLSPWTMYLSTQHGVPFWCNTDTNESTWKDPTKDTGEASSGSGAGASPNEQKDQQRETVDLNTGNGEFVLQSFDVLNGTGVLMTIPSQAGAIVRFNVLQVRTDDIVRFNVLQVRTDLMSSRSAQMTRTHTHTHTQIFPVRLKVPAARAYRAYVDMTTPHFENVVWA